MKQIALPFSKLIRNGWCDVILVFQALGKLPGIHCPGLRRQDINSQTAIDANNNMTSEVTNSER